MKKLAVLNDSPGFAPKTYSLDVKTVDSTFNGATITVEMPPLSFFAGLVQGVPQPRVELSAVVRSGIHGGILVEGKFLVRVALGGGLWGVSVLGFTSAPLQAQQRISRIATEFEGYVRRQTVDIKHVAECLAEREAAVAKARRSLADAQRWHDDAVARFADTQDSLRALGFEMVG